MILGGLSPTHESVFELCKVAYTCDLLCMCVEFQEEIILKGKESKTREKTTIFRINGKTVIAVENQKFSRSRMLKRTSPLESSYEIQSSCRISSDSEAVGISRFSRHRVLGDTWHDHVDATWHPKGVTHGKIHVMPLK